MEQVINFIDKYQLLINLGFYLIISIPILYGLIDGLNRGFKGGMWRFIKKAIFYLVFIFTLDLICNAIYNSDLFGLGNYLYTTVFKESTTEIITMKDFAETFMLKYLS
ncbi:MAG: hypothetical protein K6G38_00315, partial [Gammaproteobacteria bacterium]|nr:hypothetical protein [Gammaproteobacteria bacterium]